MQGNSRRIGPEVQDVLSAQQQAQQAQELTPLQEQLDGFRDALEQQKAAAQKLEQVTHASCCCCYRAFALTELASWFTVRPQNQCSKIIPAGLRIRR